MAAHEPIIVENVKDAAIGWPTPPEFARGLRALLFQNVLALASQSQGYTAIGDEDEALVSAVNEALRRAGRDYELRIPPEGSTFAVLVRDNSRDGAITEYGAFVPPHNGSRATTLVDTERLVTKLGELSFLESVYHKVRRLSVVSDLSLYPYWLVGRRRFHRFGSQRPEVGLHYRFLLDMDTRREARLYRAITPKWEVRRDRASGRRSWSGRVPA